MLLLEIIKYLKKKKKEKEKNRKMEPVAFRGAVPIQEIQEKVVIWSPTHRSTPAYGEADT